MPPWEQEIIYDLAMSFRLDPPPVSEITYDIAVELKGLVLGRIGERFDNYAEIGENKFDRLLSEVMNDVYEE